MKLHNHHASQIQRSVLLTTLFLALYPPAIADIGTPAVRNQIVLAENWLIRQIDGEKPDIETLSAAILNPDDHWLEAHMPAQVHEILLAQGRIPDPRVGRNCAKVAWVPEKDWVYAKRFATPPGFHGGPAFLRCAGLDTLATLYLNGSEVGHSDNMFRRHALEVGARLKPAGQTNALLIVFHSPAQFLERVRKLPDYDKQIPPMKYFRKCESEFSGYLGHRPHFIKVGLFRDVVLDLPGPAWIEDVQVRPSLNRNFNKGTAEVRLETRGKGGTVCWQLFGPDQAAVAMAEGQSQKPQDGFKLEVKSPRLWWPHTHGSPDLYTLKLELRDGERVLDAREVRFGFREVEPVLKDPVTSEARFAFKVNGKLIFLRGGCWAPMDAFTHVWDAGRANRLLDLAMHGHMNILRVWGEGALPDDSFYDQCDRRGILVWQEFMTGHGLRFPLDHPGCRASLAAEAADMVRRLRNHPSIFLWCGGNEHYLGWPSRSDDSKNPVGREVLEELFPGAVREHDPDRHYHPSSPWGGLVNGNDPLEGDWHDYSTLRFMPGTAVPLFISELCQVSPPALSSMKLFLSDEELWPKDFEFRIDEPGEIAWPPEWEYHTSSSAWEKTGRIEQFCEPRTAGELVRVLGTAHGEYLQQRAERLRRGVPEGFPDGNRRSWGSTIWRFNDPWPMIYMAAVDYYLEPKIAYYYLRRAYSPVLVCFEKTEDRASVWIVNDSPEPVSGPLQIQRLDFGGRVIRDLAVPVTVASGEARRVTHTDALGEVPRRSEFYAASFNGQTATCFLIGERYLKLPRPKLSVRVVDGAVEVRTDKLAKQVQLEVPGVTGAVFEDNHFDLLPGESRRIKILNPAGGNKVRVSAVVAEPVEVRLVETEVTRF